MTSFQTRSAPLETLDQLLPRLLQNLSLARAQIAIDHLRGVVQTAALSRIVFVTAAPCEAPDTPVAAAIALQQSGGRDDGSDGTSDAATILHAGLLDPSDDADVAEIMSELSTAIENDLSGRGARFVQWATDPSGVRDKSIERWCNGFGFEEIATLQYLGGPVEKDPSHCDPSDTSFEPVEFGDAARFKPFADLVAQTYEQTLDCPQLASYRTATQTLRGYQASDAFDPSLWFKVICNETSPESIGCLILARHSAADAKDQPPVIEIVYMGLVPAARGVGRGRALVAQAFDAARQCGAERIILAVDQDNRPARDIYQSFGLEPMLSETVWVKSIGSVR